MQILSLTPDASRFLVRCHRPYHSMICLRNARGAMDHGDLGSLTLKQRGRWRQPLQRFTSHARPRPAHILSPAASINHRRRAPPRARLRRPRFARFAHDPTALIVEVPRPETIASLTHAALFACELIVQTPGALILTNEPPTASRTRKFTYLPEPPGHVKSADPRSEC